MSVYIARRKDGSPKSPYYQFDFVLKIDGQRVRFHGSTGESTKRGAEAWEAKEKARVKSRGPLDDMTLSEACFRYDIEKGAQLVSADDLATAFEHCCRLIDGTRKLVTIGFDELQKAVTARGLETYGKYAKKPVTSATVNRQIVEPMRRLLRRARKWGVSCRPDVIDWTALKLRESRGRVRELSSAEADAFWKDLREDYKPFVVFLSIRGFRVRAAIGMKTFDVDLQRKTVMAHKKNVGRTAFPLSNEQCEIIKSQMRLAPESGSVWTYLVRHGRGERKKGMRQPITYSGLRRVINNTLKNAGITDFHIHDLRHDFASKLLRHCRDITKVQKALGHADIASTMRYAHVLDEDVGDAMEGMKVPELSRNDEMPGNIEPSNHLKQKRKMN